MFVLGYGRGVWTKELSIRSVKVLVGKACVVVVLLLPISLSFRVGEFDFRLF